ncbi:hypothetical protein BC830DRAFT_1162664 [Chytriomyces sp. MP71]|nr:hypothetical protein BC830DRAFT_1162664 [Chytriomyces sp. MP71]
MEGTATRRVVLRMLRRLALLAVVVYAVCAVAGVRAETEMDDEEVDLDGDDADYAASAGAGTVAGRFTVPLQVVPGRSRIARGLAGIAWDLVSLSDYYAEIATMAVLSVVLVLHHFSRTACQNAATSWMKATIAVWQENFAHFGDDKNFSLIRDGPTDFIFYASGRVFVKKVYGFIKLVSRYDPIGYIVSNPYTAPPGYIDHDTAQMEFHIVDELPRLFFAIIAKDQYPNIKRKRYDVAEFGVTVKLPVGFPKDHYVVLTDAPELANAILADSEIVDTLWAAAGSEPGSKTDPAFLVPLLESLIITDQGKLAELPANAEELHNFPKMMHASFKIDESDAAYGIAEKMCQLLMDVVDHYGEIRLTLEGQNKLKKVRLAAEERIFKKQEEVRKKELRDIKYQAEKKKEESMTPEQQRKYNEEKKKKELKKRSKSGKLVI